MASLLEAAVDVKATAATRVELSNLTTPTDAIAELVIDGVMVEVAAPATLAGLADAINSTAQLADNGTVARSDGKRLILENLYGENLSVAVPQSTGVTVTDAKGGAQILTGRPNSFQGVSIMGEVSLVAGEELSLYSPQLFGEPLQQSRADFGFPLELVGDARTGDRLVIEFNNAGTTDNRNALALADLLKTGKVGRSEASYTESYGELIQGVGIAGAEAQLNRAAAQALLDQSVTDRASHSGVNLDEEAANLIRFEQAYNASAQIITIARDIFNTLINAVR
jgi:flagellar hook-associated protein 1 FlgK